MPYTYTWTSQNIPVTNLSTASLRKWNGQRVPDASITVSPNRVTITVPEKGRYKLFVRTGSLAETSTINIPHAETTPSLQERIQNIESGGSIRDALAEVQGALPVYSNNEPAEKTYTTASGKEYKIVWMEGGSTLSDVPVAPVAPTFNEAESTYTIPADQVGVDYRVSSRDSNGVARGPVVVSPGTYSISDTALPTKTTIEARPRAGYVILSSYTWYHDFPDPAATVLETSDSFDRADGPILGAPTDAALGGSPLTWQAAGSSNGPQIVGNRLTTTHNGGSTFLDIGAVNQRIEFDLAYPAGKTVGNLDEFMIYMGAKNSWAGGVAGMYTQGRFYRGGSFVAMFNGMVAGHYSMQVVGTTFSITYPDGTVRTHEISERAADQTGIMVMTWASAYDANGVLVTDRSESTYFDNFVVYQIGY